MDETHPNEAVAPHFGDSHVSDVASQADTATTPARGVGINSDVNPKVALIGCSAIAAVLIVGAVLVAVLSGDGEDGEPLPSTSDQYSAPLAPGAVADARFQGGSTPPASQQPPNTMQRPADMPELPGMADYPMPENAFQSGPQKRWIDDTFMGWDDPALAQHIADVTQNAIDTIPLDTPADRYEERALIDQFAHGEQRIYLIYQIAQRERLHVDDVRVFRKNEEPPRVMFTLADDSGTPMTVMVGAWDEMTDSVSVAAYEHTEAGNRLFGVSVF